MTHIRHHLIITIIIPINTKLVWIESWYFSTLFFSTTAISVCQNSYILNCLQSVLVTSTIRFKLISHIDQINFDHYNKQFWKSKNADFCRNFNFSNRSRRSEFSFWCIRFERKLWVKKFWSVSWIKLWYSVRDGLKIKQAEWNIVKIGNSAHTGKCIRARYKNIRMETIDNNSPRTISIMSNGVIDVSCSGLSYTKSTDNPYIIYI